MKSTSPLFLAVVEGRVTKEEAFAAETFSAELLMKTPEHVEGQCKRFVCVARTSADEDVG